MWVHESYEARNGATSLPGVSLLKRTWERTRLIMSLLSPHANNPTERRRVTLRYHGGKMFGSQQEGARATTTATATRTAKKAIGLIWQNNNLARASRFFVHFLARRSWMTATWNVLISRARFMEYVNTTQNVLFLFLNLDTVLSDSTPNFATIWHIKWNWIRSTNFETVRMYF